MNDRIEMKEITLQNDEEYKLDKMIIRSMTMESSAHGKLILIPEIPLEEKIIRAMEGINDIAINVWNVDYPQGVSFENLETHLYGTAYLLWHGKSSCTIRMICRRLE